MYQLVGLIFLGPIRDCWRTLNLAPDWTHNSLSFDLFFSTIGIIHNRGDKLAGTGKTLREIETLEEEFVCKKQHQHLIAIIENHFGCI